MARASWLPQRAARERAPVFDGVRAPEFGQSLLVGVAVRGRRRQVGELGPEGLAVAAVTAVAQAEALDLARVGEPQLGGQLALVEQADLVRAGPADGLR